MNLVRFESASPQQIDASTPIAGLTGDEYVAALDFRPATGELYALAFDCFDFLPDCAARLLVLDPSDGETTQIGAAFVLGGPTQGFDFDPVRDEIRIADCGQANMRLDPDTAAITLETPLSSEACVAGLAFDQNTPTSTTTTAFALDISSLSLIRIGGVNGLPPPSSGLVEVVGPLGFDFVDPVGFDISPAGEAYVVALPFEESRPGAPPSRFYTVDLESGLAIQVGIVGPEPGLQLLALAVGLPGPTGSAVEIPALKSPGVWFLACGLAIAGAILLHARRRLEPRADRG